jgi:hypothetical protein
MLLRWVCCEHRAWADDPPKRPVPDYSNRGKPPVTPGDVALASARVVAAPAYFVTEYVIRRPLEATIPALERSGVPKSLYDFFLFGPEHKAGIVPTFLADFGLRPSVGLYAFWKDAGAPRHDMNIAGSTWGPAWLAGSLMDRYRFSKTSTDNEAFSVSAIARPDHPYYGIGPSSLESSQSRYGATILNIKESFEGHAARGLKVKASEDLRAVDFYNGRSIDGNPTLAESIAAGALPAPPGYLQDYTLLVSGVELVADSRDGKPTGSGVRFEAGGAHEANLAGGARESWVAYGGELTGAVDVTGNRGRVLSLSLLAKFVDPTTQGAVVPFTELVSLGGFGPMRGYLAGRLLDRSAFVSTFEYHWPVWNALDGSIRAEFGNVFDAHLEDFSLGLLRFSGSIGVETSAPSDNPLQILVGMGSETFEQGGKIDAIRIFVGTTTNGL